MDKEKLEKLKAYIQANKKKGFALRDWVNRNLKDFGLYDALECIYDYANGKTTVVTDIIEHLNNSKKTHGRSQVYADDPNKRPHIDIIKNNGKLELINYNPNQELNKKGQKVQRNPNIFKSKDGVIKKTYQKKEEILKNIGTGVRDLYPTESKEMLEKIILAVSNYAKEKKISYKLVLLALQAKRLVYDPRIESIRPSNNECKTIFISESVYNEICENEDIFMTEYKFNNNIKHFLSELLADPVNAMPSFLLTSNGLNRSKLIQLLLKNNILLKDEKLSDKDENGNLKTVTMKVKYKVPKKDFKHNLKKLFIKLFEENLPLKQNYELISEEGEGDSCGATGTCTGGDYTFDTNFTNKGPIRRKIHETDCASVGNYEYDTPSLGDKETLARKNGVGGSVSINKV